MPDLVAKYSRDRILCVKGREPTPSRSSSINHSIRPSEEGMVYCILTALVYILTETPPQVVYNKIIHQLRPSEEGMCFKHNQFPGIKTIH